MSIRSVIQSIPLFQPSVARQHNRLEQLQQKCEEAGLRCSRPSAPSKNNDQPDLIIRCHDGILWVQIRSSISNTDVMHFGSACKAVGTRGIVVLTTWPNKREIHNMAKASGVTMETKTSTKKIVDWLKEQAKIGRHLPATT